MSWTRFIHINCDVCGVSIAVEAATVPAARRKILNSQWRFVKVATGCADLCPDCDIRLLARPPMRLVQP
jgi:hypothetical protein